MPVPIFFMKAKDVTEAEYSPILDAAREIVNNAGVSLDHPIKDFGVWRGENWNKDGKLEPWMSADWYVESCMLERDRGHGKQIDADRLIDLLSTEPWKRNFHYDVFVVGNDMTSKAWSTGSYLNFVVGIACRYNGTVISVNRFRELSGSMKHGVLQTEAYHEIGHLFGLPDDERRSDLVAELGGHCPERGCSMKQGMTVPHDWIENTIDRANRGQPYCEKCVADLKDYQRRARARNIIE